MNRTGYLLDIHPDAKYLRGSLQGRPLVYVGHIVEKSVREIDGRPHIFLRTRSNEGRCAILRYPEYLQPTATAVYTSGDVTWIDYRNRIKYGTREEADKAIRRALPKKTYFDEYDSEGLRQLRKEGETNYRSCRDDDCILQLLALTPCGGPLERSHRS